MNHLDILLPFGLPSAEMAADLLRACKTPALAMLLARAKPVHADTFDAFARALPHEAWLAHRFGLMLSGMPGGSPPIAAAAMQHFGLKPAAGCWFVLNPVHIHIARDHLVLTDLRQLMLTTAESRALFEVARPLFEETGKTLVYGDAHTWFVQADDWQDLQTSTPDAACGHNIDIWLPNGSAERAWRKLQNDVQMHWHAHAVNQQREASGLKPVNSAWLWGGASASHAETITAASASSVIYQELFNPPGWIKALGQFTTMQTQGFNPDDIVAAEPKRGLLVLDALIGPALANDWSDWLQQLHSLEAEWFAPMLSMMKDNRINRLTMIFSHNAKLSEFVVTRRLLQQFWRKPSLKRLLP